MRSALAIAPDDPFNGFWPHRPGTVWVHDAGDPNVLIDHRPVDAYATADQFPNRPLARRGILENGIEAEWDRVPPTVLKFHDQFRIRYNDAPRPVLDLFVHAYQSVASADFHQGFDRYYLGECASGPAELATTNSTGIDHKEQVSRSATVRSNCS